MLLLIMSTITLCFDAKATTVTATPSAAEILYRSDTAHSKEVFYAFLARTIMALSVNEEETAQKELEDELLLTRILHLMNEEEVTYTCEALDLYGHKKGGELSNSRRMKVLEVLQRRKEELVEQAKGKEKHRLSDKFGIKIGRNKWR